MSNPRNAKISDQIKFVVSHTLSNKVKDPRLGFVTVTDVRVTADLSTATVFYTVLGSEQDLMATAEALESAKGFLRLAVAKKLETRTAPHLVFMPDASEQVAHDMDDLLARVASEDLRKAEAAKGASYAGDADPYRGAGDEDGPDIGSDNAAE